MTAPEPFDLMALLGPDLDIDEDQAESVLEIVTALAKSYTRGEGFSSAGPAEDVRSVILLASARLLAHARQLPLGEVIGPQSLSFGGGFSGWSLVEQTILNRYRKTAA